MSRKKTFDEFLIEAKQVHPNEGYIYDRETYINTHIPMRVICPKHGEFWVPPPKSHLLYECKACSYEKRGKKYMMTTQEFIMKANKRHGEGKFNYTKSDYKGTKTLICIICPKHGEFWQTPNDHLSGKGCPKCKESQLERQVERYLKENNIKYIAQYKDRWLGRQSLDFYLPDYGTGIECQGKQHFGLGKWVEKDGYEKIKELDIKKYNLCQQQGVDLLYLVKKQDKSYIKEDIIYKDKIYFDIERMIEKIVEN